MQATFFLEVVEESPTGTWVRVPRFTPSFTDGRIVWLWPQEAVGWLPLDEWWTAWFTTGRQRRKVDICTPARRRPDGDLAFVDLWVIAKRELAGLRTRFVGVNAPLDAIWDRRGQTWG